MTDTTRVTIKISSIGKRNNILGYEIIANRKCIVCNPFDNYGKFNILSQVVAYEGLIRRLRTEKIPLEHIIIGIENHSNFPIDLTEEVKIDIKTPELKIGECTPEKVVADLYYKDKIIGSMIGNTKEIAQGLIMRQAYKLQDEGVNIEQIKGIEITMG